jgi:predicted transcriptional regulator
MNDEFSFTSSQLRAGRALLGWSREDLAKVSGVPARTIARFEGAEVETRETTIARIRAAIEAAGIVFTTDGEGVRRRRS